MDTKMAWNNIVIAVRAYVGNAEQHESLTQSLLVVKNLIADKLITPEISSTTENSKTDQEN